MQCLYIILVCFFLLVGVISTVAVSMSKENKEGNPEYERKTKVNLTRLTIYYVIAGVVGVAAVIIFVI